MNKRFSGAFPFAAQLFVVASALLATACSDSSAPRTVASLEVGAGNAQVGPAGAVLPSPVTVTAVDDNGRGVSGVVVAFTVSAGGGSVAVERDTSDGSGNVTTQWTVGTTAGQTQTLTATAVATSIAPAQATATVVAGASSALAGAASVSGRAGIPIDPITVAVRDKYGNSVAAANVRVTARLENATGTTLGGTTEARTDGGGNALFTNLSTAGRSGTVTLVFESDGLNAARVSLVLAGGLPAKVTTVGSATLDAEALLGGPPVSAKVLDAFDNAVAGATVAFALEGNAIGSATTGNDGVATLTSWIVPQIGSYKLTASTAGAGANAQFTVNSRAVAAKTLVPLPSNPTTGSVGNAVVVGVTALDAIGRPVPGAQLTWTVDGLDRNVTADGNGIATFTVILPTKAGTNHISVRASPTVAVALDIQGLAGALATAVPEKDSIDAPAGSTVDVVFTLEDSFGNPIPNASTAGYVSTGFGSFVSVPVTSDASGKATITKALDPYAGPVDFAMHDGKKRMRVYAVAAQGSLRIASDPCVKSLNLGTLTLVSGFVFGANGRPLAGASVTWTPASGSGSVSSLSGAPQASVVIVSSSTGSVPILWFVTQAIGTYSVTGQPPAGFLPASVTYGCTVS
jgi:hypothetical protein